MQNGVTYLLTHRRTQPFIVKDITFLYYIEPFRFSQRSTSIESGLEKNSDFEILQTFLFSKTLSNFSAWVILFNNVCKNNL